MRDDVDAITEMTSSTHKIPDTSTASDDFSSEPNTESTTAEQPTDASTTMYLSTMLFSFLIIFQLTSC